jgi:hypothetical protein
MTMRAPHACVAILRWSYSSPVIATSQAGHAVTEVTTTRRLAARPEWWRASAEYAAARPRPPLLLQGSGLDTAIHQCRGLGC